MKRCLLSIAVSITSITFPTTSAAQQRAHRSLEFHAASPASAEAEETMPATFDGEPLTRDFSLVGGTAGTVLGSVGGVVMGGFLGIVAPRIIDEDACQETCAGMWISMPAGMLLGSSAGAKLVGRADWKSAFIGSTAGLLGGILAWEAVDEIGYTGGMGVGLVVHGAITALVVRRLGGD